MIKISPLRCSRIAAIAIVALLSVYATGGAAAGSLDQIRERGVLVVGVKGDYQPFGFHDGAGAIVGFEPDLASEIAQNLGVKVKLGSGRRHQPAGAARVGGYRPRHRDDERYA